MSHSSFQCPIAGRHKYGLRGNSAGDLLARRPSSVAGNDSMTPRAPGNQRLLRLGNRGLLQRKLTINQPGDMYEQEADRIADRVMRMADPASESTSRESSSSRLANSILQRCSCGASSSSGEECQECKSKATHIQRSSDSPSSSTEAPPKVHNVLQSPGRPLGAATRSFMEPRFNADFSDVRVHTDARASESAKEIGALAYTVGRDLVFAAGQYEPGVTAGQKLIAHELSHVIQQGQGGQASVQMKCEPQGLERQKFLQATGFTSSKDAPLGLTPLALDTVTYPEVKAVQHRAATKASAAQWTLSPTQTALPDPIPSYFTTAGWFKEATSKEIVVPEGPCQGKFQEATYILSNNVSELIRQGELEHCADYQYAFDISLVKFAAAVNQAAGKSICTGTQQHCEEQFGKQLEKKTGVDPVQWRTVFGCLALKSENVRDKTKQWHTLASETKALGKYDCKGIFITLKGMPGLGHLPSEIIRCTNPNFPAKTTAPASKSKPKNSGD